MSRVSVISAGTILWLLAAILTTARQNQTQQPVFRAGIAVVPVDVRVVDKNGRPVTDLKVSEFRLFENNVRQEIRHFDVQTLTPQAPPPDAGLVHRAGQTVVLGEPQNYRVFLILLGRGNLRGPSEGIKGMVHLVRDRLLPQDRVAVMGWNRATPFTTDHERIAQVLERFDKVQLGLDERLRRYQTGLVYIYGDREIPQFLQREIDTVFGGAPGRGLRTVNAAVTRSSGQMQDDMQRVADAYLDPRSADMFTRSRIASIGISFDEFTAEAAQTIEDTSSLYAAIEYLRQIEGEKHLIWLQEYGVYFPRVEMDYDLGRASADARVALSIVRAGGTQFTGAGLAEQKSLPRSNAEIVERTLGRSTTSRKVAELSGGRYDANVFKNASMSADVIEQASRSQYVLGYYPVNPKWDGAFRNIRVEVTRPGLTVLYRHGYFARQELTPFNRRAALSMSRIATAAGYAKPIPDIGVTATAAMSPKNEAREVRLSIKIDLTAVRFETSGSTKDATIELGLFCLDDRQRAVGELWRKVELSVTEQRRQELVRDGVTVDIAVPVKANAASVKVVAYDYGADLVGTANVNVRK